MPLFLFLSPFSGYSFSRAGSVPISRIGLLRYHLLLLFICIHEFLLTEVPTVHRAVPNATAPFIGLHSDRCFIRVRQILLFGRLFADRLAKGLPVSPCNRAEPISSCGRALVCTINGIRQKAEDLRRHYFSGIIGKVVIPGLQLIEDLFLRQDQMLFIQKIA